MEYVQGKTIVLGPSGPLRNPNYKQQEKSSDEVFIAGPGKGQRLEKNPWKEGEFFMEYDMACELAKAKASQNPGTDYHILQTATIFQSKVAPPETLHFKNA